MPTLSYSGELTTDVQTVKSLVEQGATLHANDTSVSVDNVSLRMQDDGSVTLIVSISSSGTVSEMEALQDDVADAAVTLGFEDSVEGATEEVRI